MGYSDFCSCLPWPARDSSSDAAADGEDEDPLFFRLHDIRIATNFFSDLNLLGQGGFGAVYKGLFPNGREVAVKKLSPDSRQGITEFTNEVKLLLRIQHINLVLLLGCCAEGPEKMLVYEYLPNMSLDQFLFGEKKSSLLNWTKRFEIVRGVARGLLYLHEEAPERIIHRDIKASNILLDEQLRPKISDFGLARLFPGQDTHLQTFKIKGTRGYMAPEYAMHGLLSVKCDVFSFGILVLEIVSSRRNHDGSFPAAKVDILNYAWTLFRDGKSLKLVDASLQNCNPDEAAACIHLGLLCCQANFAGRPDMNSINLTLSSNSFSLPAPGKPGVHGRVGRWTTSASTSFSAPSTSENGDDANSRAGDTKDSDGSSCTDSSRNTISYSRTYFEGR